MKRPDKSLFSRIGGHKPDVSGRAKKTTGMSETAFAILEKLGGESRTHLTKLWLNWDMAMGENIASIAVPLGSRGKVLLAGAEDSMALQEISCMLPEILERANVFMNENYFDKVELRLLLGETALDERIRAANISGTVAKRQIPPRPNELGNLLGLLDPQNPVGRCYAAYVNMYGQN